MHGPFVELGGGVVWPVQVRPLPPGYRPVHSEWNECGLGDIWLSQGQECTRQVVKSRLQGQFIQCAEAATNSNTNCSLQTCKKQSQFWKVYAVIATVPRTVTPTVLCRLVKSNHNFEKVYAVIATVLFDPCSNDYIKITRSGSHAQAACGWRALRKYIVREHSFCDLCNVLC